MEDDQNKAAPPNPHQGADLAEAVAALKPETTTLPDTETPAVVRPPAMPRLSYEMPGPIGRAVRASVIQEREDRALLDARANQFSGRQPDSLVVSKEDVRERAKGLLSPHFIEAGKAKGRER